MVKIVTIAIITKKDMPMTKVFPLLRENKYLPSHYLTIMERRICVDLQLNHYY